VADDPVSPIVQAILSVVPGGCTWLRPVLDADGEIVDFVVAAAGEQSRDLYERGTDRVGARLSELYPSMVGGDLWNLYKHVCATSVSARLSDFRYQEKRAGVVSDSLFDVTVHPVLEGLLVSWQRTDENRLRLDRTELLGRLGWAEYDLITGANSWSPGMYRIFNRDPALGPLSRAEQAAGLIPHDRGLSEAAWQTLDTGAESDVTVRFNTGGTVKHLRVMSDVARDAEGNPLKIYAVVQDVTAREASRTEIEQLSDQLRNREITALAEHRLAAQLQNMIQPVPKEPFALAGLRAMVSYLPAESAVQVGGDWYHAQTLPDGQVVLAIGDVAGHGLGAASGMAYLRYSLVAWLAIGIRDPGTLVGHLNRLCGQLRITGTAIVAIYDPDSRILGWSRAGHLPPLLARDGAAEPLDSPAGMMLGADLEATYPVFTPRLQPNDLVLFYTDGLVERRGSRAEDLIGSVRATLRRVTAEPGEDVLSRLYGRLHGASPYDDTCTLTVHVPL
jgi:serine phosphatase RsbU (regulator of sigma subunit)